jgi:hypothetical protein
MLRIPQGREGDSDQTATALTRELFTRRTPQIIIVKETVLPTNCNSSLLKDVKCEINNVRRRRTELLAWFFVLAPLNAKLI